MSPTEFGCIWKAGQYMMNLIAGRKMSDDVETAIDHSTDEDMYLSASDDSDNESNAVY